jgi:hypothetical protein
MVLKEGTAKTEDMLTVKTMRKGMAFLMGLGVEFGR